MINIDEIKPAIVHLPTIHKTDVPEGTYGGLITASEPTAVLTVGTVLALAEKFANLSVQMKLIDYGYKDRVDENCEEEYAKMVMKFDEWRNLYG